MDLFFEIVQRVMGVIDVVVPQKNAAGAAKQYDMSAFWQTVYARPFTTESTLPGLSNVCFQFYVYMSNICRDGDRHQPWCKLKHFYQMFDNSFYSTEFQTKLMQVFSQSQRAYYSLGNLARRFKLKRARCIVDHDLTLTPIDKTKTQQYISLYQNQGLYLFRIGDLTNLMETALCHCTNFFVSSYTPRNPFTNEPFSTAMLLAIYLRIRHSSHRMPILFELFFRDSFNMDHFVYNHESMIRERYIERLVQYGDVEVLSHHIRKMLHHVDVFPHLDDKFPKTHLVRIFRPYLSLYLVHLFSTMYGEKKENAYNVMYRELHRLMNYNPRLGRRMILKQKKVNEKFVIVTPQIAVDGYVEVFSIDHLPMSSANCDDDDDDDDDEEDDDEEQEEDYDV
jgi:hypothetical protein